MTLDNVAALILNIRHRQNGDHGTVDHSQDQILETFKRDFPYWSFKDWNTNVPMPVVNRLLKHFEEEKEVSISKLIVELPRLVDEYGRKFNV